MIERPRGGPLKAGERLVALRPDEAPRRGKRPAPAPKPPRRGGSGWVGPLLARLVAGVFALGVVLLIAGAGAGYVAYLHFSSDLPDVDGLRHYQPPVMTRVF